MQFAGRPLVIGDAIVAVVGPTGCGKTRAVLALDAQTRVAVCLPTRVAIVSAARDAFDQTGRPTGVVFFEAGSVADPAAAVPHGGAIYDDGAWRQAKRPAALAERRVLVTPYQLQRRVNFQTTVAVVDEAHEMDWERMKAIAVAAASGAPLVLVSATPPMFMTRPRAEIARRTFDTVQLEGPALDVVVSPHPGPRVGPGLFVYASLADCLAGAALHDAVALHGLLSPDDMAAALDRAAAGETVAATVGVVRSAVTLGPVAWVVLDPKLSTVRRYQLGSGIEYRTGWTAGELAQIVGRAARLPPHQGHAEVPWARFRGASTSWTAALRTSGVLFAPGVEAAREADFLQQLQAIGDPRLDDGIAALTCELMSATVAVVPFLRACWAAVREWLGGELQAVVGGLAPADAREWELGLDPGTVVAATTLGVGAGAIRRPARRWDRHRALPGAVEVPPTLWFARALALRLGPGAGGGFGFAPGLNPADERYRELLAPVVGAAAPGLVGVPSQTFYNGHAQPQDTVPRVAGLTLAQVETAALARARGATEPRINSAGTPMGGAANGPIVNACISQAARAASMLTVCAQVAHGADPPPWALRYRSVAPPQLRYYAPANASATGGDDELGAGDDLSAVAGGVMRAAVGARTGVVKTASTGCRAIRLLPGQRPPGSSLSRSAALSGREACHAFGGRIPAPGSGRGIAPFLERYFETRPEGPPRVIRVRPTVSYARSVAALLRGEPAELSVWSDQPELADLVGCSPQIYDALQQWHPVDARIPLAGSAPPSASGPAAVRVQFLEHGRRHNTPAVAGRQAGKTPGARLLSRAVQANLELRLRRKGLLSFDVVDEYTEDPQIVVPETLRRQVDHLLIDGQRISAMRAGQTYSRVDMRNVPPSLVGAIAAIAVDRAEFASACEEARVDPAAPSMPADVAEAAVLDWFAADGEPDDGPADTEGEAEYEPGDLEPGAGDLGDRETHRSRSTGSWRSDSEPGEGGAAAGGGVGGADEWVDFD